MKCHPEELFMKAMIIFFLALVSSSAFALECYPYGPNADEITAVQLAAFPESYGIIREAQKKLVINESGLYQEYDFGGGGLTIKSLLPMDGNTLMVLMGDGTYSDGLWLFDLNEHTWTVEEWYAFPNFLAYCMHNCTYYLGTQEYMFSSGDADTWNRIWDLGEGSFTCFTGFEEHLACMKDNEVWISHDAGQSWQSTTAPGFESIRYTDSGILYAIMSRGSDSDGLWRSGDFGANWEVVFYVSNLSCIGPNFDQKLILGFSQAESSTVYLKDQYDNLILLDHPYMQSPSRQMDIFPLVNTPSFYVVNDNGLYYLTDFLETTNEEALICPATICLYPNPAKDMLSIKLCNSEPGGSLILYNLRGQMLRTLAIASAKQFNWDLLQDTDPPLGSGVYLIQLLDASGKILTSRKFTLIK
ncbi:MAG TPA: hypothetical protein DG355_06075 [Candidatus Cloacimonas sp.]|jgi:hypothetical protein|nr:hypothetical protein [Candidatus Cloacimonas sp.]